MEENITVRQSQIRKMTSLADRIRKCQEACPDGNPGMETDLNEVEEFISLLGFEGNHLLSKGEMEHFNKMWNYYNKKWDAYNAMELSKKMASGVFAGTITGTWLNYGEHLRDLEDWVNLPPSEKTSE